jgi:uncharacterized protein YciW
MPTALRDVIDALAGIKSGSALDAVRNRRPQAREQAEASFRAFRAGVFCRGQRHRTLRVGRVRYRSAWRCGERGVLRPAPCRDRALAGGAGCNRCRDRCRRRSRPLRPLPCRAAEPRRHARPSYHAGPEARRTLGARLAAAFDHAHFLVFHPRDAAPARLQALLDAGWSTTDIVTLSQIIAFLSFQIRVAAGLRVLATI